MLSNAGPPRVAFLLEAVERLRAACRERGSARLVRRGVPADVMAGLADEHGAELVYCHGDRSGLARRRGDRVSDALAAAGVPVRTFHGARCHVPGSITTNEGEPYSVFSYFREQWRDRGRDDPRCVPDLAAASRDASIPGPEEHGVDSLATDVPAVARGPSARASRGSWRPGGGRLP